MFDFNVKVSSFEGPLELLLYLIKKNKLNIFDIKISVLLEQYLEYVNEMQAQNLEFSGEFLEVAATLIYIKTSYLLPKEEEEEAKQLKRELEGKLIELNLIQNVSLKLSSKSLFGLVFSRNRACIDSTTTYEFIHNPAELLSSYRYFKVKAKRFEPPPKEAFAPIVKSKEVSVISRVVYVLKKLYNKGCVPLNDFYDGLDKTYCVATFLAMLELVKAKRIHINQSNSTLIFNR